MIFIVVLLVIKRTSINYNDEHHLKKKKQPNAI